MTSVSKVEINSNYFPILGIYSLTNIILKMYSRETEYTFRWLFHAKHWTQIE
jgi:hypothetical protein